MGTTLSGNSEFPIFHAINGDIPLDTGGTLVEFHVDGANKSWGILSAGIIENVKIALGEDFYGSIFVKHAVPRVQKGVNALLAFATQNSGGSYDVIIQLVGNSPEEILH